MWVSIFLFSLFFSFSGFLSHLTPLGAPLVLGPFLILIEVVSYLIRFITLGVRLMANLTAGHLLLGLMSTSFSFLSGFVQVVFFIFEILVAVVQSYVFSLLVSIYFEEV